MRISVLHSVVLVGGMVAGLVVAQQKHLAARTRSSSVEVAQNQQSGRTKTTYAPPVVQQFEPPATTSLSTPVVGTPAPAKSEVPANASSSGSSVQSSGQSDLLPATGVEARENREVNAEGVTVQQEQSTADTGTVSSADMVLGKSITNHATGKKLVALTYDDGPHPKYTPMLLELLKKKKVPATFYLLGAQVKAYPAVAKKIVEEGFEVANHTYTHKDMRKLSETQLRKELQDTHDAIAAETGQSCKTMRPPYGAVNSKVFAVCKEMGYPVVLWDVDTNDWRGRSAKSMINEIMSRTSDGSIILFHDRYQASIDATDYVIDALRAKGYEFVSVEQLLSKPLAPKVTKVSGNVEKDTTKRK